MLNYSLQRKTSRFIVSLAASFLVFFSMNVFSDATSQLKAYPEAEAGFKRMVIYLPEVKDSEEKRFKVELIPGKVMLTDGINHMKQGAKISTHTVKGWGYRYYKLVGSEQTISTLMAVPEGAPKVEKFVAGSATMIPYNDKLPVVIYVPEDFEVKYRIWEGKEMQEVSEG